MASGLLLYVCFLIAIYGLDTQQYQYFSVAYPIYQIISLICFGWIAIIIPLLFSGVEDSKQRIAFKQIVISYALMLVCMAAGLVTILFFAEIPIPPAIYVALVVLIAFSAISDGVLVLVNTQEKHQKYLFLALIRYGSALALMSLVFIIPSLGANGALSALGLGAALSILIWWHRHDRYDWKVERIRTKDIFALVAIGIPAMVAFSVYQLSMSGSRLIIAQVCSLEAAAAIGGINDLVTGPLLLIFQVINMAFNPKLYSASNRGDLLALRKVAITVILVQLALVVPLSLLLYAVGSSIGGMMLSDRLGPLAANILPYIGISALLSVSLNTSIGVALARKRAGLMALFGLAIVAAALVLALERGCDTVGFAKGFTVLMALSGVVGLSLLFALTRPPRFED